MSEYARQTEHATSWVRDRFFLNLTMSEYMKRLITPFNIVAAILILPGLTLIVIRFTQGLGAVTSASQYEPWGLFLSWGLFSGSPYVGHGIRPGDSGLYLRGQ